jgi:hypothetical protein
MDNNLVVFEYDKANPTALSYATNHFQLAAATGFDTIVLGSSTRGYGARAAIHLWLPPNDTAGANLMILLGYVLASHPDWHGAELAVFDVVPAAERESWMLELRGLVRSGRLPIAERNVTVIALENGLSRRELICERSKDADFTLVGLRREAMRRQGNEAFSGYEAIGNVGFVIGVSDVDLERDEQPPDAGGVSAAAAAPERSALEVDAESTGEPADS